MATIKLQPSGAVVIKDGKVACSCCGCSCGVTIPQALRDIVANATINTITMFGIAPDYFVPADTQYPFWMAFWGYGCPPPESGGGPCTDPFTLHAEIFYFPETGCLSTSGFYTEWNSSPFPDITLGFQAFGDGQFCEDFPTQNGTFTINGEGAYEYYYFTGIDPNTGLDYLAVPPPNFVFT